MCGIAGFVDAGRGASADGMRAIAAGMGLSLRHRGPNAGDEWIDAEAGVALAHRRLAILDVSEAGSQPMTSACGRYVLVFNGEIYNHLEVRAELEAGRLAPAWRGHSDTETLLAGAAAWGLAATMPRLRGMFALALWDRARRCLHLARDRVGEKPLYYGRLGDVFLFGSELKALRRHPAWEGRVDPGAVSLFMRHGYVPGPYAINAGIGKLPPGTILTLEWRAREPSVAPYWSLDELVARTQAEPFEGSEAEAVDGLEALLREVVREQMISDVPLGAFLSGGIDSSTIVALMQAQGGRRVRTFTIGFHERPFDEAVHAKAVARHLGTDHTEFYVTPRDALEAVGRLPEVYDEPFGDSSQLPTYLLARTAAADVTVALSGDGGDELFGGYARYAQAETLLARAASVPAPVRHAARLGIGAASPAAWDRMLRPVSALPPLRRHRADLGAKLHKWAAFLALDRAGTYKLLTSLCLDPAALVVGGHEPPTAFSRGGPSGPGADYRSWMMALDAVSYLPDDILVKVDRAAMALGLETRVPLLDPRVIEYAWRLPRAYRERAGAAKWALRQVLYRHVPADLIDRPKQGFSVPVAAWIRGPLRDWAESLLDERGLREQGILDARRVRGMWRRHLAGEDSCPVMWNVLMFQAWANDNAVRPAADATARVA